jgi:predicted aspartyl protease
MSNRKLRLKRQHKQGQAAVYQDVWVANPKDLKRRVKLRFLVDTGCSGSAIPEKLARMLGLECISEGYAVLADGSRIKAKIAYVYMRIDDEHVFTLVAYDGCDAPLLDVDIMGLLNLQVDVGSKKIFKPLRRFTLRNLLFGKGWISREHRHEGPDKKGSD